MSEAVRALGVDDIVVSVIIGYLAKTTVIGSLLARRTRNSSDWSVNGGGLGVLFIAVGIAGTCIGRTILIRKASSERTGGCSWTAS